MQDKLILKDIHNKEITFKKFLGKKTLLIFFPFAFTGVCTKELCGIKKKDYPEVNLVGISVDSPFTLKVFQEQYKIEVDLYSDFNKDVSRYFSILNENFLGFKGVSKRGLILLNEQLEKIYEDILEDASVIPDFQPLESFLENPS